MQWPRPGHLLTSAGTVAPCLYPPDRCASYDAGNARLVCGAGYKQGTEGCSGCAVAYFEAPSGACMSCPSTDITTSLIAPLGYMALCALGFYALLAGIAWRVSLRHGGTLGGALRKSVELLVWMWQALQLMVSAARAAASAAPGWLQGLFSALLLLQFEGVTVNPSCFSYVPFLTQWMVLGVYLACLLAVALYLCAAECSRSCCSAGQGSGAAAHKLLLHPHTPRSEPALLQRLHGWAGTALAVICLIYATAINAGTQVTICMPVRTSVRSYLALKQSGAQLATAPALQPWWGLLSDASAAAQLAGYSIGEVPLQALPPALQASAADILASQLSYSVLAVNPFLVCSEGIHVVISAVGFAALVSLILLPPLSFFAVRLALRARMGDPAIVGRPTAEQWRGGLHRHWLPLASALRAAAGRLGCAVKGPGGSAGPPSGALRLLTPGPGSQEVPADGDSAAQERTLAAEAAALLDASPQAFNAPEAPMIRPWTVGDRRPSSFFFKQMDQAILFLLSIPTAFNASRTAGAAALPYAQALALQVSLLLAIVLLMAVSARVALGVGLFQPHDAWKRSALLAVFALTTLAGVLNFVGWVRDVGAGGGGGAASFLLAVAIVLFTGTVALLGYLVWSFFRALEASCKAEAEQARAEAAAAQERRGAAAAAAAAAATGRGLGDSFFSVENPLRRSHKGRGSSRGSGAGQWLGSSAGGGSSRSLDSQGRPMPLGRHRPLHSDKGDF